MKYSHALGFLALLLGVGFDVLFFQSSRLGINVVLAETLFLGTSLYLSHLSKHTLPRRARVAATFAVLFAATFALWTSDYGSAVSLVGFLVANLLFVAFAIGHEAHFVHPIHVFGVGTLHVGVNLLDRLNIFSEFRPHSLTSRQQSLALGVLCTTPIVLVFVILFANADVVFLSYVRGFTDFIATLADFPVFIRHFVVITSVWVFGSLFFAAAFWQRLALPKSGETTAKFEVESKVVLWGVIAIFALFIGSQLHTLFGGAQALTTLGVTYAHYARSGFYQMLAAAICVAIVTLTLRALHGAHGDRHLRGLHLVLITETCAVLLSAAMRMRLYIDAYGFTPARLLSLWAMATLTLLLIIMAYNVTLRQSQASLMRQGLVVLGVCMLLFTASAPDALSVQLNIDRSLAHNAPINAELFSEVTEEATPGIASVLATRMPIEGVTQAPQQDDQDCESGYLAHEAINSWLNRTLRSHEALTSSNAWKEWNWSRARAAKIPAQEIVSAWRTSFPEVPCNSRTSPNFFEEID